MAVNYTDFEKIWASASPLTPYSFTDANYKRGWDFVGSTPPSRQMWDAFMQNADEKLQYLYLHEDVPVGHEYFTFNPNVPQGSLPLFGGEYSRETYSALWSWVQEQTGYLKTESEWQALATANNGNVPYYSDGDGSTTFRVPALKCYIKAADGTVNEVGSYYAAGLPNITGVFGSNVWNYAGANASGSFTKSQVGTYGGNVGSNGGTNYNFNASLSNSIYGNSNTVTPETVVGLWLVKAYGVIQDTGTINEQQYIDDRLATKLSVNGGTMTGNITYNGSNSEEFSLGLSSATNIDFGWNFTNNNGAMIGLRSNSDTNSGEFEIFARNTLNYSSLLGKPDGTLKWAGKNVLTDNVENVGITTAISFKSGYNERGGVLRIIGGTIVQLKLGFNITSNVTAGTVASIGTLASAYRPPNDGFGGGADGNLYIESNGDMQFRFFLNKNANSWTWCTVCYLLK